MHRLLHLAAFLLPCAALSIIMPAASWAASTGRKLCHVSRTAMTSSLDKVLNIDEFRIRYATKGPDALVYQADENRNGIPDVIEDLAIQLTAARDYYVAVLGLKHPLRQHRYRRAQTVDVLVQRLQKSGRAFENVTAGADDSDCALTMALGAHLQFDRNVTPAHELFHLFQYGYAMFKVGWYLEGMARWMEGAFTDRGAPIPTSSGPAPAVRCTDVLGEGYSASRFWRSKAQAMAPSRAKPLPRTLRSRTYSNGQKVIANPAFSGGIVRPTLEALQHLSAEVSARNSIAAYDWPESMQTSGRFDQDICRAVERTLDKS